MKSLKIHPATYVFVFILLITDFAPLIIPYLLAVILHELGHAFAAKKLGYKLNKIYILPYGACLSFDDFAFNPHDEIKIALAGPLVNIVLIIITVSLWWLFPACYIFTYAFAISNFSLAFFNLLPAFPLDGGRVFVGLFSLKNKRKKGFKIISWLNIIFSALFFILFLISCFFGFNLSYALTGIFLILGIIESRFQGKYSPLIYDFHAKKRDILPVKQVYVEPSTMLYKIMCEINKQKYNIIYVKINNKLKIIYENELEEYFIKYSPTDTFENILKN